MHCVGANVAAEGIGCSVRTVQRNRAELAYQAHFFPIREIQVAPQLAGLHCVLFLSTFPENAPMVYLSKIYTKSGDHGETGLGDGQRVAKDHPRVAAYGDVDELNCVLGLLLTNVPDYAERNLILRIQNELFDLGADLCVPMQPGENPAHALRIIASQYEQLERDIDRLNDTLEPLNSFILPGGSPASGWLHLGRTVCRRAERSVVTLMKMENIGEHPMIYLNRLSDLLFVMGRVANDGGKADVLWVPGKSR